MPKIYFLAFKEIHFSIFRGPGIAPRKTVIIKEAASKSGLKGKFAARLCLTAYLLVSLGYLGVKFVNDILVA